MDLEANDDQLDFPILYGIARQGIAVNDPSEVEGITVGEGAAKIRKSPKGYDGLSIEPLLECITKHCDPYPDRDSEPLQLQVSTLAYDDYIGRLGIGRVTRGRIKEAQMVSVTRSDGSVTKNKINQIFVYKGLSRIVTDEAGSGDIVVVSGISDISIGDTICDPDHPESLGTISIEEPTLSMNFMVNTSPFAGRVGKYVTSRHIKDRLEKELEVNVGLLVEPTDTTDSFKVSGRGELHLSILIENMRREGYELAVSKPEVVIKRGANGEKMEPVEEVIVSVPDEYTGPVISKLTLRKGLMTAMMSEGNGWSRIVFTAPTRGLMGYRSEFINDTRGEGTMVRRFSGFEPWKGEIQGRINGVAVAQEEGSCTAYAIFTIQERVQMFVKPQDHVYEGQLVGMNMRSDDMVVNPCRAKKATNMRAAGSDDTIKLTPPRLFTLEEALEFIDDDELVEVTPADIRLRKKLLTELERRKYNNRMNREQN